MRRRLSTLVVLVLMFSVMMPVGAQANGGPEYHGDHAYEVVELEDGIDWKTARKAARRMSAPGCDSAHLATITSEEEQDIVAALVTSSGANAWLGGWQTGKSLGDKWRWVTNEAWDYTAWAGGEPNDAPDGITKIPGSEQYLEMIWDANPALWNDAPVEPKNYVVESEGCA